MPKVILNLDTKTYDGIRAHTPLVKHFIKVAIREKLKASTHGVKNFNELSQQPNYRPPYTGNGILLSGKNINEHKGHALIQGINKQLELFDHSPISSVKSNTTYKVIGLNSQLDTVIIKPVKK